MIDDDFIESGFFSTGDIKKSRELYALQEKPRQSLSEGRKLRAHLETPKNGGSDLLLCRNLPLDDLSQGLELHKSKHGQIPYMCT